MQAFIAKSSVKGFDQYGVGWLNQMEKTQCKPFFDKPIDPIPSIPIEGHYPAL